MHIIVQRADLARATSAVLKAVERRNTIPILSCILLTAADGSVSFRGTDLDVEVTTSVTASVAEAGRVAVDAARLNDIAHKLTGDDVTILLNEDKLVIKSGRSRFNLSTLPAVDYPDLAVGDLPHVFRADLAALFAPVRFAISTEETRYYLNGIYLHVHGDHLRAVATDGHRMSVHHVTAPAGDPPGIIVPRKAVALVPTGEIDVALSASKIQFRSDGLVITSKLIDGSFPNYQRVIPSGNDKVLSVDRKALAAAVDRLRSVANERGRAIQFNIKANTLSLSMSGGEAGSAAEDVDVTTGMDAMSIGMNSAYLLDILAAMPGDIVSFAFADPGSPILIESGADLTAVLMPMRL